MVNNAWWNCKRVSRTKGIRSLNSIVLCFLYGNWMGFSAFCEKHLHSIYVMFILVGCQSTAIECILVKGCTECCHHHILNWDTAFCPAFILSQIKSIVHGRLWCLNCSVLRKFWKRMALLIFSICLTAFIYMFLWSCFLHSDNLLASLLLCYMWFYVLYV